MNKCLCTYVQFTFKMLGWIQLWQTLGFMIYVRLKTFIGALVRQDCQRWSVITPSAI
jgi:hypothetical protein